MYKDKYIALAYKTPYGLLLQEKIDSSWKQWESMLTQYKIYETLVKNGYTRPRECCPGDIYAAALWGYGVSNCKEGQKDPVEFLCEKFFTGDSDSKRPVFRSVRGMSLPFFLLDEWLERLSRSLGKDILSLTDKNADC